MSHSQLVSSFSRNTAVIRGNSALSDDQIAWVAPSIFAEAKHDSRSQRYTYIPTSEILTALRREGFQPFYACQTRVRDEKKREHAKHMLRLRHADQINSKEAHEIILLNSHDGSSSYQILAGVYRFVCCNGMVCGETIQDVRITHKGDVVGHVIEGTYAVLDEFDMVANEIESMRNVHLSGEAQLDFAEKALLLKYDEAAAPIAAQSLLETKRIEDVDDSLWVTFNKVQENMIRGGIVGHTPKGRRTKTRAVTGIDSNIELNRSLWSLAFQTRALAK